MSLQVGAGCTAEQTAKISVEDTFEEDPVLAQEVHVGDGLQVVVSA